MGTNLAWAELYTVVAAIFGHYCETEYPKMPLWKKDERDVLLEQEYFALSMGGESGGKSLLSS